MNETMYGMFQGIGKVNIDQTMRTIKRMTDRSSRVCAVLAMLLLLSCGCNTGKGPAADTAGDAGITDAGVSAADSTDMFRAASLFWEGFDYSNPALSADSTGLERAFAAWVSLLALLPQEQAAPLAGELIARGKDAPAMQLRLGELAELYLDDPNSPYRSEELYIPVLEALITAPKIDEAYKIRPRAQLLSAMKNRPGARTTDIAYTTDDGGQGTLYGLRSEYTLLLFYNPDCHDCGRVETHIVRSDVFGPLIASGRLRVLAIYPDEDLAAWKEHLPQMPAEWIVGHVFVGRTADSPYDLPAIPCLYLLDCNKTVILKDAPVERIEEWLSDKVDQ